MEGKAIADESRRWRLTDRPAPPPVKNVPVPASAPKAEIAAFIAQTFASGVSYSLEELHRKVTGKFTQAPKDLVGAGVREGGLVKVKVQVGSCRMLSTHATNCWLCGVPIPANTVHECQQFEEREVPRVSPRRSSVRRTIEAPRRVGGPRR